MISPRYAVALYEMLREITGTSPLAHALPDERPWGNIVGGKAVIGAEPGVQVPMGAVLFERSAYPARQYAIKLRGVIEEQDPNPAHDGLPFGVFDIETAVSSDMQTYRIDAEANQSVFTVFAERVRVTANWDVENAGITATVGVPRIAPKSLFSASMAIASGRTRARRSLVVKNQAVAGVPIKIPNGARGLLVRTGAAFAAHVGSVTWQAGGPTATVIDAVPAAAVLAAHDSGQYLSVPSWADTAVIQVVGATASLILAEFEIRP